MDKNAHPEFFSIRNFFYTTFQEHSESFNVGRFRYLFRWRKQGIDWAMMQAVIDRWYALYHVFRFSMDEMYPTVEDFSYIL